MLKLAGFKTWFPYNRVTPSREIASGGSDKRFYLSMIKHLCHPPEPVWTLAFRNCINPILLGGGGGGDTPPLLFFHHHPKTAQVIKLKLSDFKDTPLRHFLQVKPVRYILSCCHGNKITKGTSQNLAPKKSETSVVCKDIELKFGIDAKFGPRSQKSTINLQFDVIMTSL